MGASQNLTAFLKLVRVAESGDDYSALVGGGNITDFSDHPANKGWPGIRTPEGRKTTAAGAYQITQTTWNTEVQNALRLPDFSPKSQDEAALWIIQFKRPGAWGLVVEGKLQAALMRLRDEWEAFDKMLAGTYPITLAEAETIYTDAGGTVA
jgi:lysozyme